MYIVIMCNLDIVEFLDQADIFEILKMVKVEQILNFL